MRTILILFMLSIVSQADAKTVIEVTEPNFTAEKIELNHVTNTYVVVNPKYFVNARDAYKIQWDGVNWSTGPHTSQHLCTFLGMAGGKIISYSSHSWPGSKACEQSIFINREGLYGTSTDLQNCRLIEFLECSPK